MVELVNFSTEQLLEEVKKRERDGRLHFIVSTTRNIRDEIAEKIIEGDYSLGFDLAVANEIVGYFKSIDGLESYYSNLIHIVYEGLNAGNYDLLNEVITHMVISGNSDVGRKSIGNELFKLACDWKEDLTEEGNL